MKRVVFSLTLMLIIGSIFAQNAVNADGSLKLKGNVAILVNSSHFTFQNGVFVKAIDDKAISMLGTATRTLCMEKFVNYGFGVVNRDDEAYKQVLQLIEENKLEDYMDGISVTAKNQGADYLFLIDISSNAENNRVIQYEFSTRLLNVETNYGYHSYYKSKAVDLVDEKQSAKEAETMVAELGNYLEDCLLTYFPEQYFVAKYNGKDWYLGAYQANGRILKTDKFYAYRFSKEIMEIGRSQTPIQVLDPVAICESPEPSDGYVRVKSSNKSEDFSDIVLTRNISQLAFSGTNQMTMTFFGLNYELNSYDGLLQQRINNAVFSAITRHPGLQLIEHDHLADLKKERELQKGEDFINGHVVEQMKAIGANYLLKLENYERNDTEVSFKMSLISVQENRIIKIIDVTSSIDNIENEMYKQICERAAFPCRAKLVNKNTIEITSVLSLRDGDDCILQMTKAIQNPVTSEITYSKTRLCSLKFKEYHGNKCIMSIDEVFSKQDMNDLEKNSSMGLITYQIDGSKIKSDYNQSSEVQKTLEKSVKKEKNRQRMKNFLDGLKEASGINNISN
ncbi:MAG: hypothetical protein II453_16430 [Alphaproteobacteria bacterium]|nr:hypothetical protein [Alphaproteobacteria bacterium]